MISPLVLEIISFSLNIIFLVLLIAENKWCWIYGILGSLTGALLFYYSHYYSEAILYVFYAGIGVYGFKHWNDRNANFTIKSGFVWPMIFLVLGGILATFGLGKLMTYTDADKPYFDAFSSVFGIIATFLELYKYLIAWIFWIVLNGYSIWLYGIKDLNLMSIQMVIYTILSFYGLYAWSLKTK